MSDNQLAQAAPQDQAPALAVREQVNQIQYLMKSVLKDGTHYGTIKGCGDKPTLLQPGAEKIAYMFKLVPTYKVEREQLGGGHREYTVECTLTSRGTGEVMGFGVGECSTMESKYRYRWDGYGRDRRRVENPDVADVWNTCLKMAKKRAFVDAVKSTTAASDVFTQDIEDMPLYARPAPQAVAAQVAPAVDLNPVRSRFKAYTSSHGLTPQQGVAAVCAAVGAASMESMTQEQANRAAAWIDSQMAPAEVEPAAHEAEQAAHAGDAEAEAMAEAVEPDVYEEDQSW